MQQEGLATPMTVINVRLSDLSKVLLIGVAGD